MATGTTTVGTYEWHRHARYASTAFKAYQERFCAEPSHVMAITPADEQALSLAWDQHIQGHRKCACMARG